MFNSNFFNDQLKIKNLRTSIRKNKKNPDNQMITGLKVETPSIDLLLPYYASSTTTTTINTHF